MSQSVLEDQGSSPLLFDLANVARVLWSRRWVVIASAVVAMVLALAYIVVTPATYVANAVVLVDPREAQVTQANNVLPGIGSDSAAIASQVSVIRSRDLLEAVFLSQQLASDPEFAGGGDMLSGLLGRDEPASGDDASGKAFDRFVAKLGVDREGLTYVINVSFRSQDAAKAARIANAVVEEYIAGQRTEKSSVNAQTNELLNERIGDLQETVSAAERAVEDYKVQYAIFDSGVPGTTILQARIAQVNDQLLRAGETAREAATAYEQARSVGVEPADLEKLVEILSSPAAEALRQDYNQRMAAFASAQTKLGPRHPEYVSQQAEIGRVKQLIEVEVQRITRELGARADAAAENVTKLETELAQLQTEANEADQRTVELRQLQRDADAKRTVLDQFLTRSQETGQLQNLQFSNARLLSPAYPPSQALWPRSGLLLAIAGVLGSLAGAAAAVLLGPANKVPGHKTEYTPRPMARPVATRTTTTAQPANAREASRPPLRPSHSPVRR
jgi:uncharacterized protein involved in exopolysaccharide biosynthesis